MDQVCPHCRGLISDPTVRCIHCGVWPPKPPRSFFGKFIKWTFIVFNVAMAATFCYGVHFYFQEINKPSSSPDDLIEDIITTLMALVAGAALLVAWSVGALVLAGAVHRTRPKLDAKRTVSKRAAD